MNLNEEQIKTVQQWIEQGFKLSEIQNKLATDLGVRMTYMEARFLLDDLKLKPKDKEPPPAPVSASASKPPAGTAVPDATPTDDEAPEPGGGVSVVVDQITRAGALVSGKVTFSDGNSADWYLDQTGRLGLAPRQHGYKPTQEDIIAFQQALQSQLAQLGF